MTDIQEEGWVKLMPRVRVRVRVTRGPKTAAACD